MLMKPCSRCCINKPLSDYYKKKGRKHGVRSECKVCSKPYETQYRLDNADKIDKSNALYREKNRKLIRRRQLAYWRRNESKFNAQTAKRRSAKLQRTVAWGNRELIDMQYALAKAMTIITGTPHHVDHIVPLMHPLVSGLHTHHNLQVISAEANRSKGNRFTI